LVTGAHRQDHPGRQRRRSGRGRGATPADAAAAEDRQQLLVVLTRIEAQLAALPDAPAGLRGDAQDELPKAREAGEQGDTGRAAEKLGVAQGYLEPMAQNLPAESRAPATRNGSPREHRR